MATYYVDPVAGLDSNSGAQGFAKQTLKGFDTVPTITLADSDVIVLVNSGAHELPLTANEYSITKAVTIRGGTALGANAVATISTTSDSTSRRYVEAAAGSAITFENIIFDYTATTADADAYETLRYNGSTGLQTFRGCAFLASAIGGSAPATTRRLFNQVSNPGTGVDTLRCYRCYFQNASLPFTLNGVTDNILEECVIINTIASTTMFSKIIAAGTGGALTITNCTIFADTGAAAGAALGAYNLGSGTGTATLQNNFVYMNSSIASTLIGLIRNSDAHAGTAAGTRGNNVLLGGADVSGTGEIYSNGWYEGSWDADDNDASGIDVYATDVEAYAQVATTVFNNPSGTFAWTTVNNLTITLPKDLRPRIHLTAGTGGSLPGALPQPTSDISVDIVADTLSVEPDETVVVTITVANTGETANSLIATSAIPSGVTLVSAVPSQGSYNSGNGQWSIGTLASAASVTLTITVTIDSDQGGNSIDWTVAYTSSDISDTNSANNTDSITIVVDDLDDPLGDDTPFIDVLPIFTSVWLLDINARLSTKINRVPHNYLRSDIEDERFREFSFKRIILGTNTALNVNLGGIEHGHYLVVNATTAVQISVANQSSAYFPASQFCLLSGGDFETIRLKNTSLTETSTVELLVTD